MTEVLFYSLAAISIISSILMIFHKNAMYSVLYLLICFFSVAGLFVMLNAQFLAVVHVIVYAGAIMVLFLYGGWGRNGWKRWSRHFQKRAEGSARSLRARLR